MVNINIKFILIYCTHFQDGAASGKVEEAPPAANYTKFNYNGEPLPPGVEREEYGDMLTRRKKKHVSQIVQQIYKA
jgi:hypothetical protein